MARFANPFAQSGYPTDPAWATAGTSLARALFGDPAARARQELQQAQVEQARSAAAENDAQALLYSQQFKARGNLAQAVTGLAPPPPAAPATAPADPANQIIVPPGFEGVARVIAEALPTETGGPAPALVSPGAGPGVAASAGPEPQHFDTAALAALAQALSQAGQLGEAGPLARMVGAQAGGEELARRSFIGAGGDPGEWFAATPAGRAAIAAANDAAAMARVRLQESTQMRGQDISAATTERGQDIGARTTERGQDVGAATQQRGQDIGSRTSERGQDVGAEVTRRGQDRRHSGGAGGGGRSGSPVGDRAAAAARRASGRRARGQIQVNRDATPVRIIPNEAVFRSRSDGQSYVLRDGVYVRGVR